MKWYEIEVYTTEIAAEWIAAVLTQWGSGGVAIEESWLKHTGKEATMGGWYEIPNNHILEGQAVIRAYFPETEQIDDKTKKLHGLLAEINDSGIDAGLGEIKVKLVKEEDWADAWKKYFHPIRVTDRLTVKPTWESYDPVDGEIIIELDPGMAFGTGAHETTTLCLKLLDETVKPGDHIIDVGAGSGILSIASAKLGASQVLALDLDPVAVTSAKENVALNHIEDKVTVQQSDLLSIFSQENSEAIPWAHTDVVVANILAEIIVELIPEVASVLKPEGTFIASGIIKSKEAEVQTALIQAGFQMKHTKYDKEWVALAAVKTN